MFFTAKNSSARSGRRSPKKKQIWVRLRIAGKVLVYERPRRAFSRFFSIAWEDWYCPLNDLVEIEEEMKMHVMALESLVEEHKQRKSDYDKLFKEVDAATKETGGKSTAFLESFPRGLVKQRKVPIKSADKEWQEALSKQFFKNAGYSKGGFLEASNANGTLDKMNLKIDKRNGAIGPRSAYIHEDAAVMRPAVEGAGDHSFVITYKEPKQNNQQQQSKKNRNNQNQQQEQQRNKPDWD